MTGNDMMRGAPPPPDRLVTLANWRRHPFSTWGFRNVRRLIPTANVARGPRVAPLEHDRRDLLTLGFADLAGAPTTLAAVLSAVHADGFIALHRGRVLEEWYDNGHTPSDQHLVFSVTKSVTGALGGALADRGLLDPDAPVTGYVPELKGSVYEDCRVRHLLDMTVGIAFTEDYTDPAGDVARYRASTAWDPPRGLDVEPDLRAFLCSLTARSGPHGHAFHYVSPNTDVLGWVYERAAGAPYAEILSDLIWQPMGAEADACMTLDPKGASRAAGGLSMTLRDMARFGETMRGRGVFQGRSVLPGWWIDDIRGQGDAEAWARGDLTMIFPKARYRSCWYNIDAARGTFCAVGIHGQWIYIDPPSETVIVRQSSQPVSFDLDKDRLWLNACRAVCDQVSGRQEWRGA